MLEFIVKITVFSFLSYLGLILCIKATVDLLNIDSKLINNFISDKLEDYYNKK